MAREKKGNSRCSNCGRRNFGEKGHFAPDCPEPPAWPPTERPHAAPPAATTVEPAEER